MTEVNEELAVKVWKADDDGKNSTQKATLVGVSARTVSRLIVARMAFQKRLANREIANRTGWSLKRVTQVHQWWTAYAGTRSQTQELPQEPEAAPRVSEAASPHRATDPEFGPRGRGLFYFGQGLRDRLSLPSPVDVVKDMPTLPPLWQGESASEFRDSQSSEEASVAREWGYSPVDATQLPSFTAFKKHLDGNPCWRELDALMEVYPRYCKSCQEAYQGLMVQYTGCSVAAGDEEARVMATAVLREVWHRVERGASLISPQVLAAKDDIVVALPWEVRMGAWAIRRRSEGEAKEVESAFLKLASTAVEEGKLQEALRLYQLLAEKREAFRRFVAPDNCLRKLILGGVWDNWGAPEEASVT